MPLSCTHIRTYIIHNNIIHTLKQCGASVRATAPPRSTRNAPVNLIVRLLFGVAARPYCTWRDVNPHAPDIIITIKIADSRFVDENFGYFVFCVHKRFQKCLRQSSVSKKICFQSVFVRRFRAQKSFRTVSFLNFFVPRIFQFENVFKFFLLGKCFAAKKPYRISLTNGFGFNNAFACLCVNVRLG